jgi:pimeloyl-ACP methyl ester carboxylesterase
MTDPGDHTVQLRDGRTLAYTVYGDPDGSPVLNCHGGLVSRIDVEPNEADFRRLGAMVVSPDRPGVGGSSRKPGHSTGGWADDARELVDALGIDRFAVMGWSEGGQYAAAVAAHLGDRVTRAAIIAGCLPLDDAATFAELNAFDRRFATMSTKRAWMARGVFGSMTFLARHLPKQYAKFSARSMPEPDAAVIRRHSGWFARASAEGGRNSHGVVDEYRAFVAPWGFTLADVQVPVHVYQGSVDGLVPPKWAGRIAAALSDATLTTYDGEGHFIAVTHRGDVVRDLLATAPKAPTPPS